jgi:hypothetical protein
MPVVYTTFLVKPEYTLKGNQKWETPVAFRVEGGVVGQAGRNGLDLGAGYPDLSLGDKIMVFAADEQRYGPGASYEPSGYWLIAAGASVFRETSSDRYERLVDMRDSDQNVISQETVRALVQGR